MTQAACDYGVACSLQSQERLGIPHGVEVWMDAKLSRFGELPRGGDPSATLVDTRQPLCTGGWNGCHHVQTCARGCNRIGSSGIAYGAMSAIHWRRNLGFHGPEPDTEDDESVLNFFEKGDASAAL